MSPFVELFKMSSGVYLLFQSFEIGGYILNNQKSLIGLDSCFRPSLFNPLGHF